MGRDTPPLHFTKVTSCLTDTHDECSGEYVTVDTIKTKYVVKCCCACHEKVQEQRNVKEVVERRGDANPRSQQPSHNSGHHLKE